MLSARQPCSNKEIGWMTRKREIHLPFFKSSLDVQLATVLLLKDQGRQAWLGSTVDIAMKLHDLCTFTEIDSCMFIFLLACRSGEKSFWQMASLQLLYGCPLACPTCL